MTRSENNSGSEAANEQVTQAEQLDLGGVPQELLPTAYAFQDRINRAPAGEKQKIAGEMREELRNLVKEHEAKETAELAEVKAHAAHKAEIARHQSELYANDTVYREAVDRINADGDVRIEGATKRQDQLRALAEKTGIALPMEDEVAEARARYDALRQSNDTQAARLAEAELHERIRRQAEAYAERLRSAGYVAESDQAITIAKDSRNAFDKAMDGYDQWTKEYMDALHRSLEKDADGLTPKDKQYIKEQEEFIREQRVKALQDWDDQLLGDSAKEYKKKIEALTIPVTPEAVVTGYPPQEQGTGKHLDAMLHLSDSDLRKLEGVAATMRAMVQPEPATPLQLSEENGPKFEVAEASAADNKAPLGTVITASNETGVRTI